jgi:hypothetical protein
MRQLYQFGFDRSAAGYEWLKEPPLRVGQDDSSP